MPGWVFELNMLSVLLGAVLAIVIRWLYDRRKSQALRKVLIRSLHLQIGTITITPATHGSTSIDLIADRRSHYIPAIGQLLSGNVLDAEKDANLIRALTALQSSLDSHNDALDYLKLALIIPGTSDEVIEMCTAGVEQRHENMRRYMDFVDSLLPPDEGTYPPARPWPRNIQEVAE